MKRLIRKLNITKKPGSKEYKVFGAKDKGKTVVLKGDGKLDMICGKCGLVLIEGSIDWMIPKLKGIYFKCNNCKSFNEV